MGDTVIAAPQIPSFESSAFPLSEQVPHEYLQWTLGSLITRDQIDPSLAGTALENALIFEKSGAQYPDITLTPSPLVDTAWHRRLLAPRLYILDYLDRYEGVIVWHEPIMEPGTAIASLTAAETFEKLVEWGENPDLTVWLEPYSGSDGRCDTCVEKVWHRKLPAVA